MADLGSTVITHGDTMIILAKGKRIELTEKDADDLLRQMAKVLKTMKDTK